MLEKELRIFIVIRRSEMQEKTEFQEIRKSCHELKGEFHQETDTLKRNQADHLEMKNTKQEIKTPLEVLTAD